MVLALASNDTTPSRDAQVHATRRRVEQRAFREALTWTILLFPATCGLAIILLPARVSDSWRLSVGPTIALAVSWVIFEALRLAIAKSIARRFACPRCGSAFSYQRTAHHKVMLGYAYDHVCTACGHTRTLFRLGRLRET